MTATLDALAVGPHPDDVELFCGGTIIRLVQQGHRVGILDLTAGELASNGTVEARRAEANAAADVMGVVLRDNLGLPDGGLLPGTDNEQVRIAADAIRRLRPEVMFVPWLQARHPDHSAAGHLMRKATFMAGLSRYPTPSNAPPHRPRLLFYQMRHRFTPSFLVDISTAIETKLRAIQCHKSQIKPGPNGAATLVASPGAMASVEARDRYYGGFLGVEHAEPFKTEMTLGIEDPIRFFRDNAYTGAFAFEDQS
ncbi:MAG: bacillithiol biosynthesis deacetylase BshB1 [Myxococcota bacterium]